MLSTPSAVPHFISPASYVTCMQISNAISRLLSRLSLLNFCYCRAWVRCCSPSTFHRSLSPRLKSIALANADVVYLYLLN